MLLFEQQGGSAESPEDCNSGGGTRRSLSYAWCSVDVLAGLTTHRKAQGSIGQSASRLPEASAADSGSAEPTPGAPLDTTGLKMEDIAAAAGISSVSDSWSSTPADYDGDEDIDVLIGYHAQGATLWRNNGGTFEKASPSAWPPRPDRHNCAWGDVNQDGRLDVYCTVGRLKNNYVKVAPRPDNELWIQQEDGSFVDVGTDWGLGDPFGRGRATTFVDANGDAFPDLYIGNALPRDTDPDGGVGGENKLFLNAGGEGFAAHRNTDWTSW